MSNDIVQSSGLNCDAVIVRAVRVIGSVALVGFFLALLLVYLDHTQSLLQPLLSSVWCCDTWSNKFQF